MYVHTDDDLQQNAKSNISNKLEYIEAYTYHINKIYLYFLNLLLKFHIPTCEQNKAMCLFVLRKHHQINIVNTQIKFS